MTQNEINRKREESQKASQELKEIASKSRERSKWMYLDKVAPVTRCYRLSNNLSLWNQSPGKNILFVTGLPASGKSTLSIYISDRLEESGIPCDVFSLDTIGFYKSLRGVDKSMLNGAEKYMLKTLEGQNDDYSRAASVIWNAFYQNVFDKMLKYFDSHPDTLVKMIEDNPSKTVIFSQIRPVVLHLQEVLPEHGIGTVCIVGGAGNMGKRMEVIESFKYDDNITVLGATSQTLGTGVTLIEATQMFFFGPPWRSTDFDQCCDRIHRIGQTQPVNIYNVSLDTEAFNLSDRMEKIMSWSNQMFSASMDIEEESVVANEAFLQKDLLEFFNQF